jgi:hypothetical protein
MDGDEPDGTALQAETPLVKNPPAGTYYTEEEGTTPSLSLDHDRPP